MGLACRGEVWIPREEWARFVLSFVSTGPAEVSLGPPSVNGNDIVVPYAANTECHPSQESVPPEWCNTDKPKGNHEIEKEFKQWLLNSFSQDRFPGQSDEYLFMLEAYKAGKTSVK